MRRPALQKLETGFAPEVSLAIKLRDAKRYFWKNLKLFLMNMRLIICKYISASTKGKNMHDFILIEQAKSGNRNALDSLVRKYYQQIYRYIYFHVSHVETAQDLTQEVFLKLTKCIHRFVATAKFSTFLYQIAHNVVVDYYRGTASMKNKEDELKLQAVRKQHDLNYQTSDITKIQIKVDLMNALNQLPENYRECIVLYYVGQLKHKEIAQIMEAPVSTIKTWIRRGLDECKYILKSIDGFEV